MKFHRKRTFADLHLYDLDSSDNLYKKKNMPDHIWQVPCELLALLPRNQLNYDRVGKGYECSMEDLMRAVINHDMPAPKPQPLHSIIRNRKRLAEESVETVRF